jgi:hypothetical protein
LKIQHLAKIRFAESAASYVDTGYVCNKVCKTNYRQNTGYNNVKFYTNIWKIPCVDLRFQNLDYLQKIIRTPLIYSLLLLFWLVNLRLRSPPAEMWSNIFMKYTIYFFWNTTGFILVSSIIYESCAQI